MPQHKEKSLIFSVFYVVAFGASAGIFHKANFIYVAASGNALTGLFAILIGGVMVFFGSICIFTLSNSKSTKRGGIIETFESVDKKLSCGFCWLNTFVAMPAVAAVLSFVAGVYTLNLFGVVTKEIDVLYPCLVGFGYLAFIFIINLLSYKVSRKTQQISSTIKYAAFAAIIILGFTYGGEILPSRFSHEHSNGWLSALAPVAFCFEGWYLGVSLARHSGGKKAFISMNIGNIIIIAVYSVYFLALSRFGSFLESGNDHIWGIASSVWANGKPIVALVLLAVLGTVDTDLMSLIHMPNILAVKGYLPSRVSRDNNGEIETPFWSLFIGFELSALWMFLHYVAEKVSFLHTYHDSIESDFAESAMLACFSVFIILYVKLLRSYKKGDNVFLKIFAPLLATAATVLLVVGGIINNPINFSITLILCLCVFLLGAAYYQKRKLERGEIDADENVCAYVDKYLE